MATTAPATPRPATVATAIPTQEAPLTPEQNPAGDIPDTQAFVAYTSAEGGYSLDVPEGWARTGSGSDVMYADKFDSVVVAITAASSAPTAQSAPANQLAALVQAGRAVHLGTVQDVHLPGGTAVFVEYTSNSAPNAVTNKQVRLENNTYLFYKNGKVATLTLAAPLGSDNGDQWQQISRSFRWL